jgi:urocanate hydratase
MVLDGSDQAEKNLRSMLFWDVYNGIARRSWARNKEAMFTARQAMTTNQKLTVTMPALVDPDILDKLFER